MNSWVKAEKDATTAIQKVYEAIQKYNGADEMIEKDKSLQEAHMIMLFSIISEVRALRMMLITHYFPGYDDDPSCYS